MKKHAITFNICFNQLRKLILILIAIVFLFSCTQDSIKTPVKSLTDADLLQLAIQLDEPFNKTVKLSNGEYSEKIMPGSAAELSVKIADHRAISDLNADGLQDAAVVYTISSGGSGTFYYLGVFLNSANGGNNSESGLQHTDSVLLGDRIQVEDIKIVETTVSLNILTREIDSPMTVLDKNEDLQFIIDPLTGKIRK